VVATGTLAHAEGEGYSPSHDAPCRRDCEESFIRLPTAGDWAQACTADGEFRLAARHWTGGRALTIGDAALALAVKNGEPRPGPPVPGVGVIEVAGASEV
jgi:hypothetical protein